MPDLPKESFTLKGGCFCSAIRYTITVPPLSDRPKIPSYPSREIFPPTEVTSHLPMISIDHCNSCRRGPGSIFECWAIMPQAWITFSLLPNFTDHHTASPDDWIQPTTLGVLKGEQEVLEATYLKHYMGNEHSNRTFCGRCGTHLTFHYSGEQREMTKKGGWGLIFDVAVGTLDNDSVGMEGFRPSYRAWLDEGIPWVKRLLEQGQKSLND